jgi:hypothetical protein
LREPAVVFRPIRVAEQVAGALHREIDRGTWNAFMPGEFELARRLGVGRSTVHAALVQLAKAGVIEPAKGRRSRICQVVRRPMPKPTTVCLVAGMPRQNLTYDHHPMIPLLHAQFAEAGVAWEQVFVLSFRRSLTPARLGRLVAGRENVCWLLFGVSALVQRWFERFKGRTLVVGHSHRGVKLPSVDMDYRAVGWHAAGCMAQRGHRRVAFVLPHPAAAGDMACREGFFDYVARSGQNIAVSDIAAGESRSALLQNVDRLMRQRSRPTAILSIDPENTVAIYAQLLRAGLRLPDDISLVGADSRGFLDGALPMLTRYRTDVITVARLVARITQSVMAGIANSPRPHRLIPRFIAGETLGKAPAAAPRHRQHHHRKVASF